MKKICGVLLAGLLSVGLLVGCSSSNNSSSTANSGSSEGAKITVGAKGFSENIIVAELYSLALENAGYTVERQYNINTNVLDTSIKAGEIDIYPEYTGTSYMNILGLTDVEFDKDKVYEKVKEEYKSQFNLAALTPSDINDVSCWVMLKEVADQYNIKTMSDLQAKAPELVWGTYTAQGSDERAEDESIAQYYGEFNWKEKKSIDSSLCWSALDNHEVDADEALTTHPNLQTGKYLAIEEDIPCRLPYYLFPVVRQEVLDEHGDIESILNKIDEKLDNETIIELVAKTDIDGEEYEDVAKDFFEANFK